MADLEAVLDGSYVAPALPEPDDPPAQARRRVAKKRKSKPAKEVSYTMGNNLFEQFVERRLAPELSEGAPPPVAWAGTKEEWEALRQQYEDVARERLAAEFAESVALRGYTPEELASGTLQPGAEVSAATGKIKRPPQPVLSATMEHDALQLLRGLELRKIQLDPVQQYKLEQVAYRRWQGEVGPVEIVLQQAKSAIQTHDSQRRATETAKDGLPMLEILWPFRGPGSRQFTPGKMKATPEQVAELVEWGERVESRAQGKTLASMGYPQWPVFAVLNGVSERQ